MNTQIKFSIFLICGTQLFLYLFGCQTFTESAFLIKEFGINIEKISLNGSTRKIFIPLNKLRDIIINEAMTTCDVKVYLAILIHGAMEMQTLFDEFDLSIENLKLAYEVIKSHILK